MRWLIPALLAFILTLPAALAQIGGGGPNPGGTIRTNPNMNGGGISTTPQLVAPSWVMSSGGVTANADLNFVTNQIFNCCLVTTRASPETYTDSFGNLTYVANNTAATGNVGLQIYGASTNLFYPSGVAHYPQWNAFNTASTTSNVTAPDGTPNAGNTVVANAGNSVVYTAPGTPVPALSTTTTISLYVQQVTTSWPYFCFYFNQTATPTISVTNCYNLNTVALDAQNHLLAGTGPTAAFSNGTITPVVGGWYRVSATISFTSGATTNIGWYFSNVGGGVQGSTAWQGVAWGWQFEPGSQLTPYIPTVLSATASRAADVIVPSGRIVGFLNGTAGTMYINTAALHGYTGPGVLVANGAQELTAGTAATAATMTNGTNVLTATAGTGAGGATGWVQANNKVAMKWAATPARSIQFNNGTAASDANAVGTTGSAYLGSLNGATPINGNILRWVIWNSALGTLPSTL